MQIQNTDATKKTKKYSPLFGQKPIPLHSDPVLSSYGVTHTFVDRFFKKVKKSDGCWLWTGNLNECGYGTIGSGKNGKTILSNRACWLIHKGKIPDGLCVLHKCDNPACVNPDHLWIGTHAENMIDRQNKGRTPKGSLCGRVKLTEEIVLSIRKDHSLGMTRLAVAKKYNTSRTSAFAIIHRLSWKHI